MKELHVLNLGAGVQSTTLYLMAMRGEVPRPDVAIFADTQEEPSAVYEHLEWLKSLRGPDILVRTAGKLGDDLIYGTGRTRMKADGGRFAAIPAFTTADAGVTIGRTRRQCSKEYKTEVIERAIRRDVLGLAPGRRVPKDVTVHQYFGISLDEQSRASRIYERVELGKRNHKAHFPLIERMMARPNCKDKLVQIGVPHEVPRSACTFCPFHTDAEWQSLKNRGGCDWERAVEIDHALRKPGTAANQQMNQQMYVHRSCKPIDEVEFAPRTNPKDMQLGFAVECEGVCGI